MVVQRLICQPSTTANQHFLGGKLKLYLLSCAAMASRRGRKGKQPAAEPSGSPMAGNPANPPIMIFQQDCVLMIEGNNIPGTPLHRATCNESHCIALIKTLNDAYNMHNTLNNCHHPNILNSMGIWQDPNDNNKAYIVVNYLDNSLSSLEKEHLFHIEDGCLDSFSALGFKVFREIFSTIEYMNTSYEGGGATSSRSSNIGIQLFPMSLESNNIFFRMVNGEPQVMLGNFKGRLSEEYVRKDSRNRPLEAGGASTLSSGTTREDIEAAHWKEIGRCLKSLYGTYSVSTELSELADFLTEKAVTYHDLLWQPGIWDASTKMQFIREIFWHMDVDRKEYDGSASTTGGQALMRQRSLGLLGLMNLFTPPVDKDKKPLKIKDDHLFDSVTFLRNKIVAHYDEEYPVFKGNKNEIGTTAETKDKYIRKRWNPRYMINLAKTIRNLGWIPESPIMRSATEYMEGFIRMKKGKK
ncbi:hypothetical protein ACP4OV_014825 [Aristida adscensionis]